MGLSNKFVEDYQQWTLTREKPLTGAARADHAVLGFISEIGELLSGLKRHLIYDQPFDMLNFIEEIGDCCFYLAMCANIGQVKLEPVFMYEPSVGTKSADIIGVTLDCLSLLEQELYTLRNGKGNRARLNHILANLQWLLLEHGCSLKQCLDFNQAKLTTRYPLGYSDAHAAERLDKAGPEKEMDR